ncbi:patatin-like phospholipase family protein [Shewanella gaetbuli]
MKLNKRIVSTVVLTLLLSACSSVHTLENRVTEDNYQDVTIAQFQNDSAEQQVVEPFRFWAGDNSNFLYSEATNTTPLTVKGDRLNALVLSGGGAKGAYGAGIVNGLYDSQQLNDYSIVTGISAGSLIAPFVFIGGDEIAHLKQVMLGINDKLVIGKKNFLNTLFKDAFTNGEKMYEFIEATFDDEMIAKIAEQHRAGRRLFIGTTQFDSEQLSIWNLGSIANSDMPNKNQLIHQVLAASASIPGVFPPQFIKVHYKGQQFEELHVDGGMAAQMFFEPINTDFDKINQALGLTKKPNVDVIRNGVFNMPYEAQPDKGVALLTRSLKSLTVMQSKGDLYKMLYFSKVKNYDVNFTSIEKSFDAEPSTKDMFDQDYMQAIYQYGYDKGVSQNLWDKKLP